MFDVIVIIQNNLAEIVDCFDYTECSATCGNGTQTCNRTCKNGSFGDVGCPNDQQVNSQTCNSQACRKYS